MGKVFLHPRRVGGKAVGGEYDGVSEDVLSSAVLLHDDALHDAVLDDQVDHRRLVDECDVGQLVEEAAQVADQPAAAEPAAVGVQPGNRHPRPGHVGADLDRVAGVGDPLHEERSHLAERLDDRTPLFVAAGREDVVGMLLGRVRDSRSGLEPGAAGGEAAARDRGVTPLPAGLLEDGDDQIWVPCRAERGHQAGGSTAGDRHVDVLVRRDRRRHASASGVP